MRIERDFMGLSSKETWAVVKDEIPDSPIDSGTGVTWSFMNKRPANPQFSTFKTSQDDRTKNVTTAPTSSPSFAPVHSVGEIKNSGGATIKQQFLTGLPLTVPSCVGPIVGVTEPWYNFKASATRGQMTIFYAGTVNVYDDISPERAQAIMLLAGNGSSMPFNRRVHVQPHSPKPAAASDVVANQPLKSQSSIDPNVLHSGSGSNGNDDAVAIKTSGVPTSPVGKPEPQRIISSLSPIPLTTMIPSGEAVPQARKASLARFLEKRKERVMSVAPYSYEKKALGSSCAGNNEASLSSTSTTNSGSASVGKET
ncbi:TIFY 6B-like protein [Drosera capensis]